MSDETQAVNKEQALMMQIQQMAGQMKFLEDRLREVSKVAAPIYPSTDMPKDPLVPGVASIEGFRADCEGKLEILPDPKNSPVPPPPPGKMRIMIGVPLLAVSYEFFESFLKFWTELCTKRDPRYEITYLFAYRRPVHMAEEWLIKQAIFNKCTHILLMDDDIYDVTVADLHKLIDAKKEMISGVMHASKFPHAMCVFRRYDTTKKVIDMPSDTSMYRLYEVPALCTGCKTPQSHWDVKFCPNCGDEIDLTIQECDLVPFPFTLIDLKVFDKINKPWFHCTNEYPTDSWFCDRLLEAGIKPHAHMTVRLNHAGVTDATKPHYVQMGMAKTQLNNAVVTLSPDQMNIHQNLLLNRMKEVEEQIKPKPMIIGDQGLAANPLTKDLTLVTSIAR